MNQTSSYSVKEDIFYDRNPEGIFILNPLGETLILDDQVAMVIWQKLIEQKNTNINKLVELILEEFSLQKSDWDKVYSDVERFLLELKKHEIVEERVNELL